MEYQFNFYITNSGIRNSIDFEQGSNNVNILPDLKMHQCFGTLSQHLPPAPPPKKIYTCRFIFYIPQVALFIKCHRYFLIPTTFLPQNYFLDKSRRKATIYLAGNEYLCKRIKKIMGSLSSFQTCYACA